MKREPTVRLRNVSIAVILIVAACVRCAGVANDDVTRDEAFSWRLIQYPTVELLSRTAADVHPPLYYLVLKGWAAMFGRSMLALRSLSVLLAIGTIPILIATVREAFVGDANLAVSGYAGAMLTAAMFAVHTSQIYAARDARMYSLGVFLAVLTSWLLLRLLHCHRGRLRWTLAYGVAVGAFCLTHNYAFFTVAAQCIFVIGDVIQRAAAGRWQEASRQVLSFALAGILAIAIYAPWFSALVHQIHEVREGYWIPKMSWAETRRVLASWGGGASIISFRGGADFVTNLDVHVWFGTIIGLVLVTVLQRHRGMWFFLLQSTVPWALSVGISYFSGRSIFLERYLIFAQVSLLGLWGVLFERISRFSVKASIVWFVALTVVYNSVMAFTQISWQTPPGARAMRFVKDHYDEKGDVIVAESYGMVNQLRYYASAVGMKNVNVRAVVTSSVHRGHATHVASLSPCDTINRDDWPSKQYRMVWYVSGQIHRYPNKVLAGMVEMERHEFERDRAVRIRDNQDRYYVVLYRKSKTVQ